MLPYPTSTAGYGRYCIVTSSGVHAAENQQLPTKSSIHFAPIVYHIDRKLYLIWNIGLVGSFVVTIALIHCAFAVVAVQQLRISIE